MHQRWIALFAVLPSLAVLLVCAACSTAAREQTFTRRLAVLKGKEDRDNRYMSTVMVNRGKADGECSGVFISAQVVITAAHCVCAEREFSGEQAQSVLDSTSCASSATVEMFRYEKKAEGGGKWLPAGKFTGAVRPYGQTKILFDAQHNVVWHYADLAAIVLGQPLEEIKYVNLPQRELTESTPVVVAGYGLNRTHGGSSGVRRFGTNTVKRVEKSKAGEVEARTEPGGTQVFEGDSGGPCLNEQGDTLVGIISSYGVRGDPASFSDENVLSICTSAYQHEDWLVQTIKQAGESSKSTR